MKKLLASITMGLLIAACAAAWIIMGDERAGNIFLFWVWVQTVCGFILFLSKPQKGFGRDELKIQAPISKFFRIMFLFVLAWGGNFVTAALYLLSWICFLSWKQESIKMTNEQGIGY